jgi:hypothetical protein
MPRSTKNLALQKIESTKTLSYHAETTHEKIEKIRKIY